MTLTLEVAYGDAAALAHDAATQLARGGLFVAVDASGLPSLAELTLRLVVAGEPLEAPCRLTVATSEAACVELGAEACATLLAAVAGCVGAAAPSPGERRVRLHDASATSNDAAAQLRDATAQHDARGRLTLERRIAVMSVSEKVQLALHGDRDARALLIRDRAGVVQSALARNLRITLDEVQALARAPQLSPETAESLSQHPTWGTASGLVLALVRNPRTPLPAATTLVARLIPSDLRVIAKGLGVRMQVAAAARKRLFDPAR